VRKIAVFGGDLADGPFSVSPNCSIPRHVLATRFDPTPREAESSSTTKMEDKRHIHQAPLLARHYLVVFA
jgi:hypothetical protein